MFTTKLECVISKYQVTFVADKDSAIVLVYVSGEHGLPYTRNFYINKELLIIDWLKEVTRVDELDKGMIRMRKMLRNAWPG